MLADVSALQTGFSVEEKSAWIYSKGKLSNLHLDTHPGAEIVINNTQAIPSFKTLSQTPMPCSQGATSIKAISRKQTLRPLARRCPHQKGVLKCQQERDANLCVSQRTMTF